MSRTYRRKKSLIEDWIFKEYIGYFNYILYSRESKEGKKRLAEYYSDKMMTMEQVPKWYKVHFCRRPFRRKETQALIQAVKYTDEDIPFPVPKKNAMYYW